MSNREIRFRVWDKKYSMMVYDPFQFFVYHFSDENRANQKEWHYYDSYRDSEDGRSMPCEVMQFTGLLDKNKNPIFEGDILSAKRTVFGLPLENGKCAEVFGSDNTGYEERTWDEVIFAEILVTENSIGFTLPKEGGTYQERGRWLQWEIIGNIYQNPELLQLPTTEK